jgi:glutathione S-transferase
MVSMSLKLYHAPPSGHCHRVKLGAALMGLPLDLCDVNALPGGRSGPAFLAINPLGQVPVLLDGGFVLRDSIAILRYLSTLSPQTRWVPKDVRSAAEIDQWFGLAAGFVFLGPNRARLIRKMGASYNWEEAQAAATRLFTFLNDHLDGRDWLVSDEVTLADVACYSYVAVAHEGDLDIAPYPNISAWCTNMRALPNFIEMPGARA